MIIPNIWENKIHVPNHQPDMILQIFQIFQTSYCTKLAFQVHQYPSLQQDMDQAAFIQVIPIKGVAGPTSVDDATHAVSRGATRDQGV